MANSNDDQKNKAVDERGSTPNYSALSRYILPALTIIAFMLALNASYQSMRINQLTLLHKTDVEEEIAVLNQQQKNTLNKINTLSQTAQDEQLKQQNRLAEVNKNLNVVLQQNLYQKQDWLLLKAQYFLELAQTNAQWSDNQQTTIALLQEADKVLQTMTEQQYFPVRQAIAKEIAQIKAMPTTDVAGMLSKLDAAQATIEQLSIKQPVSVKNQINKNASASPWQEHFWGNMNFLEKLVVVRRQYENIQPLLSPLYQSLLRETIRINLQEAQWAVLQANNEVYQKSLSQALANINRIFDSGDVPVKALVTQIQDLQQQKVNTSHPILEQSLPLLNQIIEQKNAAPVQPAEGGNSQ